MLQTKLIKRTVRLISDANDSKHPEKIYARQGDRVKVVEEMGDVLVVANIGAHIAEQIHFLIPVIQVN